MREIKFRAWGPNCEVMWVWEEVQQIANVLGWENFAEGERILMQYTGLKDKNGVEIYEGDLLINNSGRVCEVIFNEYCATFDSMVRVSDGNDSGYGFKNSLWRSHVTIIGNIHRNPELIK